MRQDPTPQAPVKKPGIGQSAIGKNGIGTNRQFQLLNLSTAANQDAERQRAMLQWMARMNNTQNPGHPGKQGIAPPETQNPGKQGVPRQESPDVPTVESLTNVPLLPGTETSPTGIGLPEQATAQLGYSSIPLWQGVGAGWDSYNPAQGAMRSFGIGLNGQGMINQAPVAQTPPMDWGDTRNRTYNEGPTGLMPQGPEDYRYPSFAPGADINEYYAPEGFFKDQDGNWRNPVTGAIVDPATFRSMNNRSRGIWGQVYDAWNGLQYNQYTDEEFSQMYLDWLANQNPDQMTETPGLGGGETVPEDYSWLNYYGGGGGGGGGGYDSSGYKNFFNALYWRVGD